MVSQRLVLGIGLFIVSLLVWSLWFVTRVPRDARLVSALDTHQSDFEYLVTEIEHVASDLPRSGMTMPQIQDALGAVKMTEHYHRLTRELGLSRIFFLWSISSSQLEIYFEFSRRIVGVFAKSEKGLVYLQSPPIPSYSRFVLPSLDGYRAQPSGLTHILLVPVPDSWYLYRRELR